MTARDLPEFATPWTDPLGVTWYVVASEEPKSICPSGWVIVHRGDAAQKPSYIGSGVAVPTWKVNVDFLRCLGRTLPPVPTPKRVAKAAASNGFEYAVKGDQLYWREPLYSLTWAKVFTLGKLGPVRTNAEIVAAAHAAFAGAGDVLPGEEGSDA